MRDGIAAVLLGLQDVDGGYGAPGSNLPETASALTLATAAGLRMGCEVLSYARKCERAPHGFNITPLSVSSGLEVQHAGLQVLRHFDVLPKYSSLTCRYVASCQTSLGGFGRATGAIARLDDSLRALQVLSMLAELDPAGSERAGMR